LPSLWTTAIFFEKLKNRKLIGTLAGIAAAVCYGTNPLGALKLYATGMQTNSVLFYRFGLAWVIIAMAQQKKQTDTLT
jgi:hypothetical protein